MYTKQTFNAQKIADRHCILFPNKTEVEQLESKLNLNKTFVNEKLLPILFFTSPCTCTHVI